MLRLQGGGKKERRSAKGGGRGDVEGTERGSNDIET
jgi:hypothetical protein